MTQANIKNEVMERGDIKNLGASEISERLKYRSWRMNNIYYIVDEFANVIPFIMNVIQKNIWRSRGHKNLILKYRQGWVSTLFIIYLLDDILFWWKNRSNYFITHRRDLLEAFFKKAKFTFDYIEPCIKDLVDKPNTDNSNELFFKKNNNTLYIGLNVRWRTPTKIHISEFAWMRHDVQTWLLNEIEQFRQTEITIESTANWMWDLFYSLCMNAKQNMWEYKLLFYWFDIDDRNEKNFPAEFLPTGEENAFIKNHLSQYPIAQAYRKIYWRRIRIETSNAFGDDWPKLFSQENPITIEDAFISSGASVFDMWQTFYIQKVLNEIEWIKIFMKPTDWLVIWVDLAEWWIKWDYCAFSARHASGQIAFQYKWRVSEIVLAKKLDYILNQYSESDGWTNKKFIWTILPENNVWLAFINECKKYSWFSYVLKERKSDTAKDDNLVQKYWFRTTLATKDMIIREYRWALYRQEIHITQEIYSEMKTYQYDETNRPNAISPNHDDLLMADMIAYNWVLHEPYVAKYAKTPFDLEWLSVMERHLHKVKRGDYSD